MDRALQIRSFYELLTELEARIGGRRRLGATSGRDHWPSRGVYFFFEPGEVRQGSGNGRRVVRVGTHALTMKSRTKLWQRLRQHRGSLAPPGGNHRGSIFRLLVGEALASTRSELAVDSWGRGSNASRPVRDTEAHLEQAVSRFMAGMELLILPVDDDPGPESVRGYIERNTIALLSDFGKVSIDPPSAEWLGRASGRERVRQSGLWNNNHVDEIADRRFLSVLGELVRASGSLRI